MPLQRVTYSDLGTMPYQEAWDLQEQLLQYNVQCKSRAMARERAGLAAETETEPTRHYLLFTEHPHVYTLGKNGDPRHILISEAEMAERGISYYHTNRGGDITYHGPGQIVGYPILDLEKFATDIGLYLRRVEEVIIRTLALYGLEGKRSAGETGVWLDPDIPGRERKICAIGVRCSRWVTMHGFAFNVNTDLTYFDHIIPCGIVNKQVTSLQRELGHELNMSELKAVVREQFASVFQVELVSEFPLEVKPLPFQ